MIKVIQSVIIISPKLGTFTKILLYFYKYLNNTEK